MYGKLNNGVLIYAPVNYTNEKGQLIVNFNKNEDIMKEYGFKEVINIRPAYDPVSEHVEVSEYVENDNSITIIYNVVSHEPNTITLYDRVTAIECQLCHLTDIFTEEVNK